MHAFWLIIFMPGYDTYHDMACMILTLYRMSFHSLNIYFQYNYNIIKWSIVTDFTVRLSQDDIHNEYLNQEMKREWNEFKHNVVVDVINSRGIRPGYGKWAKWNPCSVAVTTCPQCVSETCVLGKHTMLNPCSQSIFVSVSIVIEMNALEQSTWKLFNCIILLQSNQVHHHLWDDSVSMSNILPRCLLGFIYILGD